MVYQWDHIEMNFRTYDNITGITLRSVGSDAPSLTASSVTLQVSPS